IITSMVGVFHASSFAQTESAESNRVVAATPELISLKGIVTAQQKYSFTLTADGRDYKIKLAEDASVGLLMNRPYFDWKAERVFVEAVDPDAIPATEDESETERRESSAGKGARVGYVLPTKQFFLIAKFRNPTQMERVMTAKEIRLNLYLLSPVDLGRHEPNEDELYLAGKVATGKSGGLVTVETDSETYKVRLGFRTATMNGFSIADLKPGQTHVTLTGSVDRDSGTVIATSVGFQPIEKK
ncbi:MAG: hypothetical protein WBD31_26625, partial [Rubripirellula sp.]